jgi:hypothetical protein
LAGAIAMVYDNYNRLVVGFCPNERPSDAIFSLVLYPRRVGFCFLQGAVFPTRTDCSKAVAQLPATLFSRTRTTWMSRRFKS